MDPIRNPFAPGAGSPPPELVGRDEIIKNAEIAIQRILRGKHDKSQILLGLRGTGKTVLLNKFEEIAQTHNHLTSFIEAPDNRSLAQLLYPKIHQILRKLSLMEKAKAYSYSAMRALRGFASVFKVSFGDLSLSVDPETGVADSGDIESDLSDLFILIGKAAKAGNKAWTLIIDEVQYLNKQELSALIVAIHKVCQKQLPIIFFGAGLPQIAAMSGNAKSYAERLFVFPKVGPLDELSAKIAIKKPINEEGEEILASALDLIVKKTKGYAYFLQEWGYQAWNVAEKSPINDNDIKNATIIAQQRLDDSFFKVRYERLTPKEKEYVMAMAKLGKGPYRSSEVAKILGENVQSLGPLRAKIIHKGMIYSQAHGDIDFTVPMFEEYLLRLEKQ